MDFRDVVGYSWFISGMLCVGSSGSKYQDELWMFFGCSSVLFVLLYFVFPEKKDE
jgi:hypothetical protein